MTTKWIFAAQSDDDSPTPPTTSIPRDRGHERIHDQMMTGDMMGGDTPRTLTSVPAGPSEG